MKIIKLERNDTVKAVEEIVKEMEWHKRAAQQHGNEKYDYTLEDWVDSLQQSYLGFKDVAIEMATGYGIDDYEYDLDECPYYDADELFEELVSDAQYVFNSKGKWTASQVIPMF